MLLTVNTAALGLVDPLAGYNPPTRSSRPLFIYGSDLTIAFDLLTAAGEPYPIAPGDQFVLAIDNNFIFSPPDGLMLFSDSFAVDIPAGRVTFQATTRTTKFLSLANGVSDPKPCYIQLSKIPAGETGAVHLLTDTVNFRGLVHDPNDGDPTTEPEPGSYTNAQINALFAAAIEHEFLEAAGEVPTAGEIETAHAIQATGDTHYRSRTTGVDNAAWSPWIMLLRGPAGPAVNLSDADPKPLGSAADSGTAPAGSRADHVHVLPALTAIVPGGTAGQVLTMTPSGPAWMDPTEAPLPEQPEAGKGALMVSISGAAGQWSINGGTTWLDSGATAQVNPGTVTITFSTVAGYDKPQSITLTVAAGTLAVLYAAYTAATGGTHRYDSYDIEGDVATLYAQDVDTDDYQYNADHGDAVPLPPGASAISCHPGRFAIFDGILKYKMPYTGTWVDTGLGGGFTSVAGSIWSDSGTADKYGFAVQNGVLYEIYVMTPSYAFTKYAFTGPGSWLTVNAHVMRQDASGNHGFLYGISTQGYILTAHSSVEGRASSGGFMTPYTDVQVAGANGQTHAGIKFSALILERSSGYLYHSAFLESLGNGWTSISGYASAIPVVSDFSYQYTRMYGIKDGNLYSLKNESYSSTTAWTATLIDDSGDWHLVQFISPDVAVAIRRVELSE